MSFFGTVKRPSARISYSAFKVVLLTTTAIAALTLAQTVAYADGGAGGAAGQGVIGGSGGAGGTGPYGSVGGAGVNDTFYGGGGGGGGSAGGGTGGIGGAGDAATHAAGGTLLSPDGATGDAQVTGEGGSGGGGGGGFGGNNGTVAGSITNTGSISGANGGNGGTGGAGDGTGGGGGGGGGAGGYGAFLIGAGSSTNSGSGTITGGNGGNGGVGGASRSFGGNGGNGGDGGIGVALTTAGTTSTNSATITGGNGGNGGDGGTSTVTGGGNGGNGGTGGAGIDAVGSTIINTGSISGGNGGSLGLLGTGGSLQLPVDGVDGAGGAGIVGSDLTINNSGTISGGLSGDGVTRANAITFTGGANTLTLGNSTSGLTGDISVTGSLTLDQSSTDTTIDSVIKGTGSLIKTGTASVTLSGSNTYTGGTTISAGTLLAGSSTAFGTGGVSLAAGATLDINGQSLVIGSLSDVSGAGGTVTNADTVPNYLTVGSDNTSTTFSGVIQDGVHALGLIKQGTGTFTLAGTNTYTGATTVNAGTLNVTGSIGSSSLTTVNSGSTLIGTGTVGNLKVTSGGTFAPGATGVAGGTTSVSGTLTLDSGSNYFVAVGPTSASHVNVSGTASLAGTATAAFGAGVSKQYTFLTSAGLGGTTFNAFSTTGLPTGFVASLEYTSTDVLLNLTSSFGSGGGLNTNQQNVATSINNYFNNGGSLPSNFLTVFGLSGSSLGNALSQLSGEGATAGANGGFQMMDQFFSLMSGMSTGGMTTGGALSFAPEKPSLPLEALAYASTPEANVPAVGGWTYWGSAFGGWNRLDGNGTSGTNTVKASSYGFAMGADFQYSADTVMGVALAYGRTEWDLTNSLGGGDSDALQLGVHGKTNFGPAYLSTAAGIANHWMTTERYAAGDHLKADFNAQVYSGRLEAGYRFEPSLSVGLTPYAAVQVQHFRGPSHTEEDLGGGGFALSYDAMRVTNTRTELGTRFDHSVHLGGKLLKLGAGLAWAHDHSTNSSVTASFTSLPGSSFSVQGVSRPANSVLLSGGAELKLASGWTLAANLDSEQGDGYGSYAGKGTLSYAW